MERVGINRRTTQTIRIKAGIRNTIKKEATRSLHITSNTNRISHRMEVTVAGTNLMVGIKGKSIVREANQRAF
jgi:hypothetical protein